MKISTLIAVVGVLGALTAAMVTFLQMENVAESQARAYNEINTLLFASSWTGKSEESWSRYLDRFNPEGFSEEYDGVFEPDSDISVEPGFIFKSIVSGDYANAKVALDDLFFFVLEDQRLTFVMVYDLAGEQIYCGYAKDFPGGVDPCSATAKTDFQDDLAGFLSGTDRAKRTIVRVDDLQGIKAQRLIRP